MHRPHAPAPAAHSAPLPAAGAAEYICPMDPEVHESAPGACPVCGMALEPASPLPASRTEYVCPMHPEIVRPAPGECPICGMALEPRTVAVEEGPNPELLDMRRRFWVSAALAAPLLAIAMAGMLPALRQAFAAPWLVWLQLALATPVVLWGGAPFFARGWRSIVDLAPEHVHADRDRHRHRVRSTASSPRSRRGSSRSRSGCTGTSRSTSRPPP